ncbi:MAG: ABC transporter permease [Phycisphaerales bacterium]
MPSAANSPTAKATPRAGRRIWTFLAGAQEIGLLVVIALMCLGLWLSAGTFPRKDRQPQPPGTTVQDRGDIGFALIAPGAGPREFTYANGWSYLEPEPGAFLLVREREASRFLNAENLINLLTYASFIAIMAVGMTAVIILGGIDLSIGSVYGLAAVAGSAVLSMLDPASSVWIAVPVGVGVCMLVGAACGAINGLGTVGLGVHPFIITLGGMAVYRGVAFIISKGQTIGGLPDSYRDAIRAPIWDANVVPSSVMILVGALGAIALARTVWGRRVFAIGGNEIAARYAGVPVGIIKISVFAVAGALAGLSAALIAGHLGGASSDTGRGYELDVIAAAVVGGAALSGGRGSALGAVLGAIVIQLINNGFDLVGPRFGVDQNYRQIVIGLAIVLAVVVDQAKQRLRR